MRENVKMHVLLHKRDLLQKSLTDFFSNSAHFDVLSYIVYGHSPISLRILNFFITTYARNENVIIKRREDFNVYQEYKICLKAYSIKYFDPFCRRERIQITSGTVSMTTTVGQMNIFKWVIENDILEYIMSNHKDIIVKMKESKVLNGRDVSKKINFKTSKTCVSHRRPNTRDDFILTF